MVVLSIDSATFILCTTFILIDLCSLLYATSYCLINSLLWVKSNLSFGVTFLFWSNKSLAALIADTTCFFNFFLLGMEVGLMINDTDSYRHGADKKISTVRVSCS